MSDSLSAVSFEILKYLGAASLAAALLYAVGWIAAGALRMRSAVKRHMVRSWCLAGVVLLPLLWFHGPKMRLHLAPENRVARVLLMEISRESSGAEARVGRAGKAETAPSPGTKADMPPVAAARTRPAAPSVPVAPLLAGAWALGAALMFGRLGVACARLRRIRRAAAPISGAVYGGPVNCEMLVSDIVEAPLSARKRRAGR